MKWLTIIALTLMAGCGAKNDAPPTAKEIVGVYHGNYAGGNEVYTLKADGEFTQCFRIGTNIVYESSGRWDADGNEVDFSPWYSPDGMLLRGKFEGAPKKLDSNIATWNRNPVRIELGAWPFFVRKEEEKSK